eukprot:scpid43644/ scgid30590/ Uncharacterized protein C15orf33 homolog
MAFWSGNSAGVGEPSPVIKPKPTPPPRDGDEWLKREGLSTLFPEIPDSFLGRYKIDYHAETLVGTEEEIAESLREKSELDFSDLERLASNIDALIEQINQLHIMTGPSRGVRGVTRLATRGGGGGGESRDSSVVTATAAQSAAAAGDGILQPSVPEEAVAPGGLGRMDTAMATTVASGAMQGTRGGARQRPGAGRRGRHGDQPRGISSVKYPGFDVGEVTSLPVVVEPAELLSEPVSHLEVSDDFKRKWRQVMTNEMSILLLQDVFWWFFLEHFSPDAENQDLLFSRIADTFVWMLDSPSMEEYRDDMFQLYPHCLSQSLLYSFCRMFPSSRGLFDDDFRTDVANTIWQWISGIVCPPRFHWSQWPLSKLGVCRPVAHIPSDTNIVLYRKALQNLDLLPPLKPHDQTTTTTTAAAVGVAQQRITSALQRAAAGQPRATSGRRHPSARPVSSQRKRAAANGKNDQPARPSSAPLSIADHVAQQLHASDLEAERIEEQNKRNKKVKAKSHTIGSDADYRRVIFDMKGRSPLVEHFLVCHRNLSKRTNTMIRAEMEPDRSDDSKQTFDDALQQTRAFGQRLEDRYRKAVEEQTERALALQAEFAVAKQHIQRDADEKCRDIMRRRRVATDELLDKVHTDLYGKQMSSRQKHIRLMDFMSAHTERKRNIHKRSGKKIKKNTLKE